MKKGTHYAKKLKAAYGKIRGIAGAKPDDESVDPVSQLILAILSQEATLKRAQRALKQITDDMVDFNELRVSTPAEVSDSIGKHVPRSIERAKALLRLLNAVYEREYAISLDSLGSKGVREMKSYLESLEGITPYVSASVLLWSLGGHAIPVNDIALDYLRKQGLVEPDASAAEVQAFLERHVSAADAKEFCLDLEAAASTNTNTEKATKTSGNTATRKKAPAQKTSTAKKAAAAARKKTKPKTKTAKR